MKILCTLKINPTEKRKIELDLSGKFNRAAVERELKEHHPWWFKNKDRIQLTEREPK